MLRRICGTGYFNNPNDLSRILVVGMLLCVEWFGDRSFGLLRVFWAAPLAVFGYAFGLTNSRGGMIALLPGIMILCLDRWGWRKSIFAAMVILPTIFVVFAGRQTRITTNKEDTGQERIRLWSEGQELFKGAPVFGIGMNRFHEEVGLVAHNSFVHCYVELGFFGGTMFVGALFCAVASMIRLRSAPGARGLRTTARCLMAIIVGNVAGMMTISRCFIPPTYMLLGLASALAMTATRAYGVVPLELNRRTGAAIVAVSLASVAAIYLFVRTFIE